MDFFQVLGVPRRLNLDLDDLEQRYRTLSRQFHPDFFHNADPAERRLSLERSSQLNDAYRMLKPLHSRTAHLLELEEDAGSVRPVRGAKVAAAVPPALLEEVFAINEEIDLARTMRGKGAPEAEWRERLEHVRQSIVMKRDEHARRMSDLAARWDALPADGPDADRVRALTALRDELLEQSYITNLILLVDRELSGMAVGT